MELIMSQKGIIGTLQSNLMEENDYIIQSTLELLNNLSFSSKT